MEQHFIFKWAPHWTSLWFIQSGKYQLHPIFNADLPQKPDSFHMADTMVQREGQQRVQQSRVSYRSHIYFRDFQRTMITFLPVEGWISNTLIFLIHSPVQSSIHPNLITIRVSNYPNPAFLTREPSMKAHGVHVNPTLNPRVGWFRTPVWRCFFYSWRLSIVVSQCDSTVLLDLFGLKSQTLCLFSFFCLSKHS